MEWWKRLPEAWKTVAAMVAGIAMIIGTYRGVDGYVAKKCDLDAHKISNSKDIAEVSEATRKGFIQQDMRWNAAQQYDVKKRLKNDPNSEADEERLEELKLEKEKMERELREIKNSSENQTPPGTPIGVKVVK